MRKLLTFMQITAVTFLLLGSTALLVLSLPGSGWKALSVQTGSMTPAIQPGDLVLAHSIPASKLKAGDVITYINPRDKTQTITHRITEVKTVPGGLDRFVTKGDANQAADSITVYGSQIIGISHTTIPKLGSLFDWLRTWPGLIVTVYTPALIVVVIEIRKLSRYYKSLQPYVIGGFDPKQSLSSPRTQHLVKASTAAVLVAGTIITPTVHAALMTTTKLASNSITTVVIPPAPGLNHPLISKVAFASSSPGTSSVSIVNNNSQAATSGSASGNGATSGNASNSNHQSVTFTVGSSTPAKVTIYNPTSNPLDLSGWTLADNASSNALPSGTVVAASSSYIFVWPVADGLERNNDHLLLRNPSGSTVDSLSWGSDVSQLSPAIATDSNTATITRQNLTDDSNTASDWQSGP